MEKKLNIFPRPARDTWAMGKRSRATLQSYYADLTERMEGRLTEKYENLCDGVTNHWYEYIPSSYDGKTPVPLVLSCHAGNYYALAQVYDTCWCELSEREGFLAVFPEASSDGCWTDSEETLRLDPEAMDFVFIRKLIEELSLRYNIDKGRIYMHGMSRGNLFTSEFAIAFGSLLAGIGESSGPSSPDIVDCSPNGIWNRTTAVPTCQMRCSYDNGSPHLGFDRQSVNLANRRFWQMTNGCDTFPILKIGSRELFAYYKGKKADVIYKEAVCHGHYETVADAEECWTLFSTVRRAEDGSIVSSKRDYVEDGDKNAIAVADHCDYAYVDHRRVWVGGRVRQYREVNKRRRGGFQNPARNEDTPRPTDGADMCVYYYAPLTFVADVFGLSADIGTDTASVTLPEGIQVAFALGSSAAAVNDRVRDMGQTARLLEGQFCIPLDWFAESVMGRCTAQKNGVLYIADHQVTMTDDFSIIIKEILHDPSMK